MTELQPLEGASVLTKRNGSFKQLPLYRRDTHLFAKTGSSFVQLRAKGETSVSKLFWLEFDGGYSFVIVAEGFHPPQAQPRYRLAAE